VSRRFLFNIINATLSGGSLKVFRVELSPERLPALVRNLGAELSLAGYGASQDLFLPADDDESGLDKRGCFSRVPLQKGREILWPQVEYISSGMMAEKLEAGRGRLPQGIFRPQEGDARTLDLQLFQDSFQLRMIPDHPDFPLPLKKAKTIEGLLRDAEAVREIAQDFPAFSFACEGGQ
jgi:hypothetical protein